MLLGGQSPNGDGGAEGIIAGPSSSCSPQHQHQNQNPNPDPPPPPLPPPGISTSKEPELDDTESTYHLKWIQWNEGKIPIVMQSRNGPCPLIATINVLLLKEKVKLPTMLEQITANQLLTYLGECIMDSSFNISADMQNDENTILNMEQNIHDAMEILPKLSTGLDVNIRFTGITDFEYTPECIIFDLLRIPLYHGWLSDPSLIELQNAIGNQSYNQLVDNIITNKASTDPEISAKVLIAEEFLERTASQLTLHGLNELKSNIKDNEIGILFRNNHFLTLFKRENEIYTLVTDHGYLTEDNIIWETLDNIEGAGSFFDANFQASEVTNKQVFEFNNAINQQLENDFLMALSLRVNDNIASQLKEDFDRTPAEATTTSPDDDFALAKILQAEERLFKMARERKDCSIGEFLTETENNDSTAEETNRFALSNREYRDIARSRRGRSKSYMSQFDDAFDVVTAVGQEKCKNNLPSQSMIASGLKQPLMPLEDKESLLPAASEDQSHHRQTLTDPVADHASTSAPALNPPSRPSEVLADGPSSALYSSQTEEMRSSPARIHQQRPNSSRRPKSEKNLKESNCIVN